MQNHMIRIWTLDNIADIAECKPTLPQLFSDMLIIKIDGSWCTNGLTGMKEKLFNKETNVL